MLEGIVCKDNEIIQLLNGSISVSRQFILDNCYVKDDDMVLLASSLVEGMGNRYSDLDVYVVCENRPRIGEIELGMHHRVILNDRRIVASDSLGDIDASSEVLLLHTVIPGTEVKIDVEFKTKTEVIELFGEVECLFEYAIKNLELLSCRLTEREIAFLHRLSLSFPIRNAIGLEKLLRKYNSSRFSYLAYRWLASDFSVLLDIAGAHSNGEWDRCIELCRKNVLTQTQALLHLHGVTNYDSKWLLYYFHKVFRNDTKFKEQFFEFYYLNTAGTDEENYRYVIASLNFVDEIFRRSRKLLSCNPLVPSKKEAILILKKRYAKDSDDNCFSRLEEAYRSLVYENIQFRSVWLLEFGRNDYRADVKML